MASDRFTIEGETMTRHVVPRRGGPYEHRCQFGVYVVVATYIDQIGDTPFLPEDIVDACDLPWTQVYVAIGFLDERGIIETIYNRRRVAASRDVYLDAMTEWHARREKPEEAFHG